MTMPDADLPTSIRTPRENLDLPVRSDRVSDAIEFLEGLREQATAKADFVTEACAGVLSSQWSGEARDSFETLRTNLVTDLDECATQAETTASTLKEIRELVDGTQERMAEIRSRIWTLAEEARPVGHGGVTYDVRISEVNLANNWPHYEIWVATEEARQTVQSAIADGVATRIEFREKLEQLVAQFDSGPAEQVQDRWRGIVYDADGEHPVLPGDMVNQPFILPDQATGTHSLWVDGQKYVTTATPVSDLEFAYDEATDMFVVEFEDKTERFLPGTEFRLHAGDGKEYTVSFRDDGSYAIVNSPRYDETLYNHPWILEEGTAPPVEKPSDTPPIDIVPLAP